MTQTPKEAGFFFPAEWHSHIATWLTFPINVSTWEDRFDRILPAYMSFIKNIALGEKVRINTHNLTTAKKIKELLEQYEIPDQQVELFQWPVNDAWCRDHGPAFLIHRNTDNRMIVDWGYNAWGGKYPPFDDDNAIPRRIAKVLDLPSVSPGIIMEGGSVEFNGAGTLLTSKSCLNHPNRNPSLSTPQIEEYLSNYYGVEQILWVSDGIVGDDTDGHIDDTIRFVNQDTVLTMVETNKADENHHLLSTNLKELKQMRLPDGKPLNIVEIEMPDPVIDNGLRLPASYANFYISNANVVVPTYRNTKKDEKALIQIQELFPNRKVVGIDSCEIIWGLGSFHCLSQQEPAPII